MENPMQSGYKLTGLTVGNGQIGYFDEISLGDAPIGASPADDVSGDITGVVETQTGDPISDATVVGIVSKQPTTAGAQTELDNLSNPIPDDYTEQINNGFSPITEFGEASGTYAALYRTEDVGIDGNTGGQLPWVQSSDLSSPVYKDVPVGKPVVVMTGDATAGGALSGLNEYARQIPGEPVEADVTIEQIGPDGSVINEDTITTSKRFQNDGFDISSLPYNTYTFSPGVYRITTEGGFTYFVKAGSPTAIVDQYLDDVNGQLTDYSQRITDKLSNGSVERVTTTTNREGEFGFNVNSSGSLVHIQAYKSSALTDVKNVDPKNVTPESIREEYGKDIDFENGSYDEAVSQLPNGSIYFPSQTKRVSPPSENVSITMYEMEFPPLTDLTNLQEQRQKLLDKLRNGSFEDLVSDRLEDMNREELEGLHSRLDRLRERNSQLSDRYEDLLANTSYEGLNPDINSTSDEELKTRVKNLQQMIRTLQDTIDTEQPVTDIGSESMNARFTFGDALERDDVTVLAHWSNGTTTSVDDEYITLDEGVASALGVGSTTVLVNDYPLSDQDPNAVEFEVLVANEDGVGSSRSSVKNPTFSGELPKIDSVSLSSLEPGPSETVQVKISPAEDSSFSGMTGATVYGPSGSEVATISESQITDGKTFQFQTEGAGRYWVEAAVQGAGGDEYTVPFDLRAGEVDENRPPGIRAKSGPLGTYAVVGDGFESGSVETTANGNVEIIGQVKQGQDPPSTTHVYLNALEDTRDSTVTVRVTQGPDRESINSHVAVMVHGKQATENALAYRSDSEPLTRDASTRFGRISQTTGGTLIETYTDAGGSVTIRTINEPSISDRALHWVRVRTTGIDIPFTALSPLGFGVPRDLPTVETYARV
jgi:hypothetical protein